MRSVVNTTHLGPIYDSCSHNPKKGRTIIFSDKIQFYD